MRLPYLLVFAVGVAFGSRLPHPPVFTSVESYPSICYLPPDSGLCPTTNKEDSEESQDLLTRYYFDMATEQCYPFGVQNCGGNENRFPSKANCMTYCKLEKGGNK
ncbi:hypothetical protein PMAYCL1PPCAC_28313 [Pristionchus mayeri]|uniref:BPTI/Kunitz inhibitor domain-containing protein n=1 Tax=Pristionchus mayeri TaxID=1317129 RepID=A0AAN5D7W1_9BILA|nr:hypothetical protein PMAYCL1PPCAC_28313 [Pristionchus mayeri]